LFIDGKLTVLLPLLIMLLIEELLMLMLLLLLLLLLLCPMMLLLLLLLLCPTMLPSTVQLLLDRPVDDWLLEGLWTTTGCCDGSPCPSMELLLLLVPNFSAAAYEVTAITFLKTGGEMLADALLPDREACFLVVEGAGPLLLLVGP